MDKDDGDEELTQNFKAWAKSNLEMLTIPEVTKWLDDRLGDWTKTSLDALNIKLPLKPHTVSKWMHDAGFVYSQYKKCYCVNTHKKEDVITDRKKYCEDALASEINAPLWIQLPLKKAK